MLVDLLTPDYGRVGVLARGARAQHSRYRGFLRPFVPILVSWSGRSELVSLNLIEAGGAPYLLEGRSLLAGMYLNELLVRLLHQQDPQSDIFEHYEQALKSLNEIKDENIEPILRRFEKEFLVDLGFGFSWTQAIDTSALILVDKEYTFDPDQGFSEKNPECNPESIFSGSHLVAISENNFQNPEVLRTAKKIMRTAIQLRLGHRKIKSRELFI